MTDIPAFTSFAPGFEFLQGLVKNAGAAMPGIGQWVAPTLNPEELDKRIQELKTVQFWLEQNARMLGATIQALEVQKMTLATLQTMNVQMSDLRDSLTIRMPDVGATQGAARSAAPPDAADEPEPAPAQAPGPSATGSASSTDSDAAPEAKPAVDPMQWWGALTQQFSELAANAMKEGAAGLAAVPGVAGLNPGAAANSASGESHPAKNTASKATSPTPRKTAAKKAARRSATPAAPGKAAPRARR